MFEALPIHIFQIYISLSIYIYIYRYMYIFDTCNFKEFVLYSVSYKELLKDLKLENNKMKFEF